MNTTTQIPAPERHLGFWHDERARRSRLATGHDRHLGCHQPATESVRTFLDSRHGRHFADDVQTVLRGATLPTPSTPHQRWMGWTIGRSTSKQYGIPKGLPYHRLRDPLRDRRRVPAAWSTTGAISTSPQLEANYDQFIAELTASPAGTASPSSRSAASSADAPGDFDVPRRHQQRRPLPEFADTDEYARPRTPAQP